MNKANFNRRDFLKLLSMLPPAYYMPKSNFLPAAQMQEKPQNFIILVYDAWSADNISLYGYPRNTTPFLEKLADRAIVYHHHYAGGHWTYPGTATLLTGVHPWSHRGYTQSKQILETYHKRNIFSLFDTHYRMAYSHNFLVEPLLLDMLKMLDYHKPWQELYLNNETWLHNLFPADYDMASLSWIRTAKILDDGYANSLFFSRVYDILNKKAQQTLKDKYPLGLPVVEGDNYFTLETATDWITRQISSIQKPFLGYYHLLPPHAPYHTRNDFYGTFQNDGYSPINKPLHPFVTEKPEKDLEESRREYDEYILYVDSEINRLYTELEQNKELENTWLIITSDHGEMFERGLTVHKYPSFHQPLVHVPLLILPPGSTKRVDIHTPTSTVDLIPTLLHLSGKNIPDWLEGELLPPYHLDPHPERPIYSMDARFSKQTGPFTTGTVMLRRGDYKLTYLFGNQGLYKTLNNQNIYELYNIRNDPEELDNLYKKQPKVAQEMQDIIYAEMEKHRVR